MIREILSLHTWAEAAALTLFAFALIVILG
jgi:hypothetical protein